VPDLPADADELYQLPLEDFTKARDDLAKRLTKESRRDDAAAVKALKKPTVATWSLNQVAWRNPSAIHTVLEAGAKLREAHEAALSGDASALKLAKRVEDDSVENVVAEAGRVMQDLGRAANAAQLDRVRDTVRAAALDVDLGARLRAGRLVEEAEAIGFGDLSIDVDAVSVRKGRSTRPPEADADQRRRVKEAERQLAAADAEYERRAAEAERLHQDAEVARRRATEAFEHADEAWQERETARGHLDRLMGRDDA
jgi:hypothetical protein